MEVAYAPVLDPPPARGRWPGDWLTGVSDDGMLRAGNIRAMRTRGGAVATYTSQNARALPAYTVVESSRYLRIPLRTVQNWAFGSSYPTAVGRRHAARLIEPAEPERHLLSFDNLLELHVLGGLRRDHKLKMPAIRSALNYLRREYRSDRPLLDEEMFTHEGSVLIEKYGRLVNASQEGQLAMHREMGIHLQRIERDEHGMILRLYPFTRRRSDSTGLLDQPQLVAIDPMVAFGRPVITGSRVPTAEVADRYLAGDSVSALAEDYGRSPEEIEEAIRCELVPAA